MTKLEIRHFGDPVLRQRGKRIPAITKEIDTLIDDMIQTMRESNGVGLAAPQIGKSLQLTVIEVDENQPYVFINPEIIRRTGKRRVTEGCLSLPGWYGEVERSEEVVVRAKNRYGKEFKLKANELLAQAIEHEVDHLNGVLFTDRLTSPDRLWKSEKEDGEGAHEASAEPSAAAAS